MERRIASALILVNETTAIERLNRIIGNHSSIILGRQGLPDRFNSSSIISLILEGTTDEIGSLTGQLGKLPGVSVKSIVMKNQEKNEENL